MKYELEEKTFPFEIKALTEEGSFEGYSAIFDKPDAMNEIVDPDAFTKSLKEGSSRPLLWYHDIRQPLGLVELEVDAKGLRTRGQLNMGVKAAQEKYLLLKQKAIRGLSFGFKTVRDAWEGVFRHLKEVKLYEVSLATFQMHPQAIVSAVKSAALGTLGEALGALGIDVQALRELKAGRPLAAADLILINDAISALKALGAAEPPTGTLGPIAKGILSSVIEELETKDKPHPHLFGSTLKDLENSKGE